MGSLIIQEPEKLGPKCESIGCSEPLGYFDIKNNSRFCRKCRINYYVLRWKCKGCEGVLNSSECRETRKYCNKCKGMYTEF